MVTGRNENRLRLAPIRPIQVPLAHGAVRPGVAAGAAAIDAALRSHCAERGNLHLLGRLTETEIIPVPPLEEPVQEYVAGEALYAPLIAGISQEVAARVRESIQAGELALTLGGDHAIAIGSIAGAAAEADRLAVIWIDAHADLNWPEVSPSGHIHGMALAVALGRGLEEFSTCPGQRWVQPRDTYLIGIRSVDAGERSWLAEGEICHFTIAAIDDAGLDAILDRIIERVRESEVDAVHVSFDVDVLDPLLLPGTGTTEWGGLGYREAARLLRRLRDADLPIRSLDWTELNPDLDPTGRSTVIAAELLAVTLGEDPL
ncbi:MAG TPA: arginase family protein [Nitrolancea sp.]|nr:arginase family protein [Nitrolancea sp.]